jgi:hypothetical protein
MNPIFRVSLHLLSFYFLNLPPLTSNREYRIQDRIPRYGRAVYKSSAALRSNGSRASRVLIEISKVQS